MTRLNQNIVQIDKQWAAAVEIDLRQYWQVISEAKTKILALAFGASLLAALWVFSVDPVYEASTTLLIETGSAKVVAIEEVYSPDNEGQEYYQTQFELLNSPTVAAKVIDELQLLEHPEFAVPQDGDTGLRRWLPGGSVQLQPDVARQKTIGAYLQHLDIAPIDKTQLVKVSFESRDRELAASIANAHARSYIANMLETKLAFSETAASWMSERLQGVKSNLQKSEQALQEFREKEQVFDAEGLQSLSSKNLNELTSRLVEVQRELEFARSAAAQVKQVQATNTDELESIPAVSQDTLVQRFKEQKAASRRAIAELGKTYGPKHPKMMAAVAEFKTASGNLRRQIDIVVTGINKSFDMAEAEQTALLAAIDAAKQQYHVTGRKESQLLNLQREVQTNRQLYDIFYSRMKETAETGGLQSANARVVAPAFTPLEPVKPNKPLTIAMAFIASLLLGVLIAFLEESFDNTLKKAADVEHLLHLPLLGGIPKIKSGNSEPVAVGRTFLRPGQLHFKEAIRTIRTGISLSARFKPHKMVMITSSVSGEGKSITALNLAYAFGQMDQVLLVECDLRRPTLGTQLRIPSDTPGISQLLANEAALEDCIVYPESDKIQFITAGAVPDNPVERLASPAFTKLILQLRHDYDLVILDCPPVLPVSDATVIASKMDAAIFVIKAGSTPLDQIKAGLEKLRQTDAAVIGAVVNAVNTREAQYSDPYGAAAQTVKA